MLIQREGIKSSFRLRKTDLTDRLCKGIVGRVIFTITGPSGVGKDVVIGPVLDGSDIYVRPISFTTRPPRPGEGDGIEYYFISKEEFARLQKKGEIFEHSPLVSGHYYGYTNGEIARVFETGKTPIFTIEEDGLRQIVEKLSGKFDIFKVFVLPPTARELANRLKGRGLKDTLKKQGKDPMTMSGEELNVIKQEVRGVTKKRFNESRSWIDRANNGTTSYDGFLVNDDLEGAIEILKETFERVLEGKLVGK